jgi:hypothetical protein
MQQGIYNFASSIQEVNTWQISVNFSPDALGRVHSEMRRGKFVSNESRVVEGTLLKIDVERGTNYLPPFLPQSRHLCSALHSYAIPWLVKCNNNSHFYIHETHFLFIGKRAKVCKYVS